MRKFIAFLLCTLFVLSLASVPLGLLAESEESDCDAHSEPVQTQENQGVPIAELELDEDLVFLKDYDILVPEEYVESGNLNKTLHSFVKMLVDTGAAECPFSYTKAAFLYKQLSPAVVVKNKLTIKSRRVDTTKASLASSTVLGAWRSYYSETNCYCYGIGVKRMFKNPGYLVGKGTYVVTGNTHVSTLASLAKEDLLARGFSTVTVTKTAPSTATLNATNSVVLAVRVGSIEDEYDYHFMRYNPTLGAWVHKPGDTHVLKYKYQDVGASDWRFEFVASDGSMHSYNYYYNSDVYYLIAKTHSTQVYDYHVGQGSASGHTNCCMLCGKNYSQAHTPNAANTACKVCGRSGPFTALQIGDVELSVALLPELNGMGFGEIVKPKNEDEN